jgi:outer membrane protein assembly factor BamB
MNLFLGVVATFLMLAPALPARAAAEITPANVSSLMLKWNFPVVLGVTSSPVVANGLVYVTGADSRIYALDPDTGAPVWSFRVSGGGPVGIQGTVVVTPDGNVCVGDSGAHVWCLNGRDGTPIWDKSLTDDPINDHIWSALAMGDGRLFAGIASFLDNPCTPGRLVALDLATGAELWTFRMVPDKICDSDASVECTDDAQCDGGKCIDGCGAGVTAGPIVDPTGKFVYVNTVGSYTFPSIGDSDSMLKIDAATGQAIWRTRVDPPEQFGICLNDGSIDCGTDAMCSTVGGNCQQQCVGGSDQGVTCSTDTECDSGVCRGFKSIYHDFGFLNGPLWVEVGDGAGGTRPLIVSASKNGTLYAFNETDGSIVWENPVMPKPVSPGSAGWGLFNGAIFHTEGQIHAALHGMFPPRVCREDTAKGCMKDSDCDRGVCLPEPDHLMTFDARNGDILWSDDIGPSWAHVGVANGVLYTGVGTSDIVGGSGGNAPVVFYAYDAKKGTRLATFPLPSRTVSRATVAGDSLYIGYGIFDVTGGVRAYTLCGNGVIDDGEDCDDAGDADCCSSRCTFAVSGASCDVDANRCTDDGCDGAGTCVAGGARDCDDANPCTDDRCDPVAGCQAPGVANGTLCGDRCGGETCQNGTCTAGIPPACDDGNVCTDDRCDSAAGCVNSANNAPCDDGDPCTADHCVSGACVGAVADLAGVTCAVTQLRTVSCAGETLPSKLARTIEKKSKQGATFLDAAMEARQAGDAAKARKFLERASEVLGAITKQTQHAVNSRKKKRQISTACRATIDGLVHVRQGLISGESAP